MWKSEQKIQFKYSENFLFKLRVSSSNKGKNNIFRVFTPMSISWCLKWNWCDTISQQHKQNSNLTEEFSVLTKHYNKIRSFCCYRSKGAKSHKIRNR